MKKRLSKFLIKLRRKFVGYFMTNRLFISYVILALIGTIIARGFSFGHTIYLKAHAVDLALILIIGSFGGSNSTKLVPGNNQVLNEKFVVDL